MLLLELVIFFSNFFITEFSKKIEEEEKEEPILIAINTPCIMFFGCLFILIYRMYFFNNLIDN